MQLNVHIDYSRNLSLLLFVFMGVFLGVFFGGKLRKKKKKSTKYSPSSTFISPKIFLSNFIIFILNRKG